MQLTFDELDEQTIEKATARFLGNHEMVAFSGIKFRDGDRHKGRHEVNAEIVAAICRAWLAATDEPPMKGVQIGGRRGKNKKG